MVRKTFQSNDYCPSDLTFILIQQLLNIISFLGGILLENLKCDSCTDLLVNIAVTSYIIFSDLCWTTCACVSSLHIQQFNMQSFCIYCVYVLLRSLCLEISCLFTYVRGIAFKISLYSISEDVLIGVFR